MNMVKKIVRRFFFAAFLTAGAVIMIYPFKWMISASFKVFAEM